MAIFWRQKILPKQLANFLEKSDLWQYLPNLAPSGNPAHHPFHGLAYTNMEILASVVNHSDLSLKTLLAISAH